MRPLLALDFDGVISDSALECFWVAAATDAELRGSPPEPGAPPPAPGALRGDPRLPGFLELLPLGNRAEDFGAALRILERDASVPDQAAYDAFKAELDPVWLGRFHERFYARRRAVAAAHPRAWHALMRPYPGIGDALRRLAHRYELAIATSKDRKSVGELLAAYGLADLFRPGRLLDKETGPDKAVHLRRLHERSGVPLRRVVFVDDKVSHLERAAALGVCCVLAAWGYNGERERERARRQGFRVVDLERFAAAVAAL